VKRKFLFLTGPQDNRDEGKSEKKITQKVP